MIEHARRVCLSDFYFIRVSFHSKHIQSRTCLNKERLPFKGKLHQDLRFIRGYRMIGLNYWHEIYKCYWGFIQQCYISSWSFKKVCYFNPVALVTIQGLLLAKNCNKQTQKRIVYANHTWCMSTLHTKPWSRIFDTVAMATGNRPIKKFCNIIQIWK